MNIETKIETSKWRCVITVLNGATHLDYEDCILRMGFEHDEKQKLSKRMLSKTL
jgi:Trp operon repressor